MNAFEFAQPQWLWLLLSLPVLAYLLGKRGRSAAVLFSSNALVTQAARHSRTRPSHWLALLRLLTLACIIVALARPRTADGYTTVEKHGVDILLAVDISGSMNAMDFERNDKRITRVRAVKYVLEDFIQKRPNDRIGIIAFAGYPYLISPPTLNHDWLLKNLNRNIRTGRNIADGTAIGHALALSTERLSKLENAQSRIVILLSDGENNINAIPPLAAAEAAAIKGVRVYTIGMGSLKQAPVYRMLDEDTPASGHPVAFQPPMDTETLEAIAQKTEGTFYRATDYEALQEVYTTIDSLETTEAILSNHEDITEYFFYPTALATALLILELLLAHTRYRRLP